MPNIIQYLFKPFSFYIGKKHIAYANTLPNIIQYLITMPERLAFPSISESFRHPKKFKHKNSKILSANQNCATNNRKTPESSGLGWKKFSVLSSSWLTIAHHNTRRALYPTQLISSLCHYLLLNLLTNIIQKTTSLFNITKTKQVQMIKDYGNKTNIQKYKILKAEAWEIETAVLVILKNGSQSQY